MKQIYSYNVIEILHVHKVNEVTEDIIFFKNRHKHILNIKTTMSLDDEEILDMYLFRKYIEQILSALSFDIKDKTYDMLATYIKNKITEQFTNHDIEIDIREDNVTGIVFKFDELET